MFKLHKYFYSFILLVSLASFTGYANTSNSIVTITELVDESKSSNLRSLFYSDYLKVHLLQSIPNYYILYNFETLLNTQNSNYVLRLRKQQAYYSFYKKKQELFFLKALLQSDSHYFSMH
jgi:hypothetical protein